MDTINNIFGAYFASIETVTGVVLGYVLAILAICGTAYVLWRLIPMLMQTDHGAGDALATLLLTVAVLMIYSWVLLHWQAICDSALDRLLFWANGDTLGDVKSLMRGPGFLWDLGQRAIVPIAAFDTWHKGVGSIVNAVTYPLDFLSYMVVLIAFMWLAFEYGMALLEWTIAVLVGAITLALSYLRPVQHLGDMAVGWLCAAGIKLLVLILLAAVAFPLLEGLSQPAPQATPAVPVMTDPLSGLAMPGLEAAPKMTQTILTAGASLLFAILAFVIPRRAARLAGSAALGLGASDVTAGAMTAGRWGMMAGSAAVSPIRGTSRMIQRLTL